MKNDKCVDTLGAMCILSIFYKTWIFAFAIQDGRSTCVALIITFNDGSFCERHENAQFYIFWKLVIYIWFIAKFGSDISIFVRIFFFKDRVYRLNFINEVLMDHKTV